MNATQLPDPALPWPIHMDGVMLVAEAEQGPRGGCALVAYKCPAGVWTIGWGETDGVVAGQTITKDEADRRLCAGLEERASAVRGMCTDPPDQFQLAAMTSLSYNIGTAGLKGSTVLRRHNAGDANGAARAFALWNKAKIKGVLTELDGLTARRAAEAALYLRPDPDAAPLPQMPQAVEAESSMAVSPINLTAAVPVVGGGVTLMSALSDQVKELVGKLGDLAGAFGISPTMMLGAVAVLGGGVIIWNRMAQRRGGWA